MTDDSGEDGARSSLGSPVDPATFDADGQGGGDAGQDDGDRGEPTVAGALLTAGSSTRYGEANKLLQPFDGEPLVRHAARTLVEADLDRVIVVVGHEPARVREALAGLPVSFVANPDYEAGQATSVRRAVEAVPDADAIVFALGDMPAVSPATVDLLVAAFRADVGDPVAASYEGERGNPVLFGRRHFDDLARVEGDSGGRRILLTDDDAALVATGDPGVRRDVDTPDDLDDLRRE